MTDKQNIPKIINRKERNSIAPVNRGFGSGFSMPGLLFAPNFGRHDESLRDMGLISESSNIILPEEKLNFFYKSGSKGSYLGKGREILDEDLEIPTGDQLASLIHAIYFSEIKDEQEPKDLKNKKMTDGFLYIFNRNIWRPEGVYVIHDPKARGLAEEFDMQSLEKKVNQGNNIEGVLINEKEKIRFAPKNTYKFGDVDSEGLAKDGFVMATFGVDGAKKIAEVARSLSGPAGIMGKESGESISALFNYHGRLGLMGIYDGTGTNGSAFGVKYLD